MNGLQHVSRLQLNSFRFASEHVDGAWWPRSRHLIDELPDLLASVSERLGQVVLVGYSRSGWDDTPLMAEIHGHTIELLSLTKDEPASIILIGEDGRQITLHVIAPGAEEQIAQCAFDKLRRRDDAAIPPAEPVRIARSMGDVAKKLIMHEGSGGDEQRAAQIRRWCEEAAQQFVDAPVQSFVPILVEHIVHDQMLTSRRAAAEQRPVKVR